MDGDTRPRPSPEARYELLYRLLVIAAIAVIMVSLVGIASMTGLLPRVGEAKPNAEVIRQRPNDDSRQTDTAAPTDKPSLRAVPLRSAPWVVFCGPCSAEKGLKTADNSVVSTAHRRARAS